MMKNSKFCTLCFTLAVVLAGSLLAIPSSAKTLVYCSEASPETFNPQFAVSGSAIDATQTVFERLAEFERGTTTIVPGLATNWDISADGTVYTFYLRKGVKFHTTKKFTPTRDFNADDVIFSFMRILDKNHPYHNVSGGSYPSFESTGMPELIKDVVKLNDNTVRFVLNRPEAPFIGDMALVQLASIMSAEYAEQMMKAGTPEDFDFYPVGTGPFQRIQYQKDFLIRYKAFPQYWRGKAPIDNLIFAITPDSSVRWQKLKTDECQVMSFPNVSDLPAMRADPNIRLMSKEGMNLAYLGYNTVKKPFTDVKVRKALNMAIDKQAIIQAVYRGSALAAKSPISPVSWAYNDNVVDAPYDPMAARNLLAEAGYPKGFKTDIWAIPIARPYNPNGRLMAEMIQADWAKIGVRAKIVSYEWGEYLKRTREGEEGTFLLGWGGSNPDPDYFFQVLLSCDALHHGNRSQWCNREFDDLINRAKITSDIAERTRLYKKAQLVFKRGAPWATLAHPRFFEPVRKEVIDYKVDSGGVHYFYGVGIKE